MATSTSQYVPGVCNINPAEIRQRKMTGHVGLIITLLLVLLMIILSTPNWIRAIVFIPAFLSATGYLQARAKFCVKFASAGMQHADDSIVKVEQAESLAADKKRALTINLQAAGIALVTALIVVVLPL